MSTVYTERNSHDEWWQDTYICFDCGMEFMTEGHDVPRFCPRCGVKFDALRICTFNYETGLNDIEMRFLNN